MKKLLERVVVLLATITLVLGMVPKDIKAGTDYKLVPVDGDIVDLTGTNHKHLNLNRADAGCCAYTVKECHDDAKVITIPANTTDHECTVPVGIDEVYNINVLNADKLDYTISNGSGSSYEGTDLNKTFTYKITKTNGIKLKVTNPTSSEKKITVLVMPNNTIYSKNSQTRLIVGKNTRFNLNVTNLPEGEYALKIIFFTDETFSKKDYNNKFSRSVIHNTANKDGYYVVNGRNDIIKGEFLTTDKAYIMVSLAKVTDISAYDTVENNDLFDYRYTVKEDGIYMRYRANNVGTKDYNFTRDFKNMTKGQVQKSQSLVDQGSSYVSFKKLSDISSASGVKDKFSVIDNSYLFCPSATDDYYFTSETPLGFLVTDISNGSTVSSDGTVGAHLEKGKKYAISVSIVKGSRETYEFRICKKVAVNDNVSDNSSSKFGDFVERLYVVALGRPSEKEGKDYWCHHVGNGDLTGAQCTKQFLLSDEFKARNLNDSEFVKVLYKTFFNRNAEDDPNGYEFWLNSLKTSGRDNVVNGFINSEEWNDLCAFYGVRSGAVLPKTTKASSNATAFATRLYTECLGRAPEQEGLDYWSLGLTNQELTGTQAARAFFYCDEFLSFNLSNEEYLTRLYKTFMGREPDTEGYEYWLDVLIYGGASKDEIFDYFASCQEFTQICKDYDIIR
ncbi:MAG: DUF4214 domain-containing protein [Clostridiales bacterium]|nr:DUF4214 domain-containing protein [Clostridiales bacterium]